MKAIVGDLIAEQSIADAFVDRLSEKEWNETIHSDLRVYDIEGIWKIRDVVSHIAIFDEAAAQLAMGKAEQIRDVTGGRMDEHLKYLPYLELSKAELLQNWRESRTRLCSALYDCEPKKRIPWAPGLPMSARSLATARLMELWAHWVDIYDHLGVEITESARVPHILFLSWQSRPNAYRINGLELPDTPVYLELQLADGSQWTRGEPNTENYIKGKALDWALVAVKRRNWMDTGLEVVGDEARRYADVAQTFAGPADLSPLPKHIR